MRISKLFSDKKGQKTFIAYITAGDPTLLDTEVFVSALARGGADIVELGVPYSDPIADGPTNIRAAERALRHKVTLTQVLETVGRIRTQGEKIPIVIFTYFNPVLKIGIEKFAQLATENGVDGVLFVDLPPEEAQSYVQTLNANGLETVFLCSPTTDAGRLEQINALSSGFVYYVSRTGVTGVQKDLSQDLEAEVGRVRQIVKKPLAVGFGISTPAQASQAARSADAVVIGSAIVNIIEKNEKNPEKAAQEIQNFAREIVGALGY